MPSISRIPQNTHLAGSAHNSGDIKLNWQIKSIVSTKPALMQIVFEVITDFFELLTDLFEVMTDIVEVMTDLVEVMTEWFIWIPFIVIQAAKGQDWKTNGKYPQT